MNVKTQRKIPLTKEGGVYTAKVMFLHQKEWLDGSIIIDSGAEECVMPMKWFPGNEVMPKTQGIGFMGADGADLGNFGRKLVEFVPKAEFETFRGRA